MKRIYLVFLLFIIGANALNAKDKVHKSYINLSFCNSIMQQEDSPAFKTNYGATFTAGKTYYFHKKKIGNFLQFGLDVTWFELNYNNYAIKHMGYWGEDNFQYHQLEYSLHIGPGISINPIGKFNIHGYYRFAPSYSAMYLNETIYGGYTPYWIGGVSISLGTIGLGFESKVGSGTYKVLEEFDTIPNKLFIPNAVNHNSWRAYITFRF